MFAALGIISVAMHFMRDYELVKQIIEVEKNAGISPSFASCLIAILWGVLTIKKDLKTEIIEKYKSPKIAIEIVEGDLFSQKTFDLVIGACNTFDTQIPDIIAKNSIQGKAIDKLFDGDIEYLNRELKSKLKLKKKVGKI